MSEKKGPKLTEEEKKKYKKTGIFFCIGILIVIVLAVTLIVLNNCDFSKNSSCHEDSCSLISTFLNHFHLY